jgi:subtilase family serine protease
VIYQPRHVAGAAGRAGWAGPALASTHPTGLGATQLEQAYHLPVSRGAGQTVAVSIAYNTPHLAQYLARYRAWYHLPACTTASGCLRIVNQHGQATPLPASSVKTGWDVEATLDVSMISAACPHCHIVVVEGTSNSFGDLAATENTAARLGAQVISNSYGARETGAAYAEAPAYHHPGHTIVVATGDDGYTAAQLPAALSTVTAVGGTQLTPARDARGWAERTWFSQIGASGSGCSAYVAKPAWQHDKHCAGRTVADVSAAASDISIYEPVYGGWLNVDGTSAAAPLIAGIYGLAGNAATIPLGYAYAHSHDLFDITQGTNSGFVPPKQACGDDYLCVAKPGYDGPTGLGTPNGTGAF